jgi:hypothetical protein
MGLIFRYPISGPGVDVGGNRSSRNAPVHRTAGWRYSLWRKSPPIASEPGECDWYFQSKAYFASYILICTDLNQHLGFVQTIQVALSSSNVTRWSCAPIRNLNEYLRRYNL